MDNYSIQQLKLSDWQRFRTIRLRALEESPDAFGSTLEREQKFTAEEWPIRLTRENVATFIAVSDEENDLGLTVGAPYDDAVGLFGMWVAPEARGTGVGGALVDAVIRWAKQSGHQRILLDVGDDNTPAITLYESKGFVRTGITGTLPPPRESITEHQRAILLV